jgi:two-component system, chemotaxis family, chemotaxis protein CheY
MDFFMQYSHNLHVNFSDRPPAFGYACIIEIVDSLKFGQPDHAGYFSDQGEEMARVLLVDDSTYQRTKLRKFLETAGYEVVECSDGEEGLRMAASIKPDCMMLDLIMPKVDGMQVLQELHEKHLTIPVVIHTSDIQEETRQECLALGAVAFLNKPARDEDLLAVIARAIQPQGKESGNATLT